MATPRPNEWDAAMHDFAGLTIRDYVRARYTPEKDILLDIGAGWGKYRHLMPEFTWDAVEIFGPNVESNRLREFYRNIFIENACEFAKQSRQYAATILGDTLEHIAPEDAVQLVTDLMANGYGEIILAVPYEFPQDEVEGNKYEIHLQPDLTYELMQQRYPMLERIGFHGNKGVYVSKRRIA